MDFTILKLFFCFAMYGVFFNRVFVDIYDKVSEKLTISHASLLIGARLAKATGGLAHAYYSFWHH